MTTPRLVLLAVLATAIAGCYRQATDSANLPPPSTGPWSVNGIHLGVASDECRSLLGEPAEIRTVAPGPTVWKYGQPASVDIVFDARGTVVDVTGTCLTGPGGVILVSSATTEAQLRAILPNATTRKLYQPTGSGVISFGGKHVGTAYTCTDAAGRYTLSFREGTLQHVRAWQ